MESMQYDLAKNLSLLFFVEYLDKGTWRTLHGSGASSNNDYIKEAKEYIAKQMIKYGEGTEVPIKSLLGQRTQTPPQVYISEQQIKVFKDFLLMHPDIQIIADNVVLVENNHRKATIRNDIMSEVWRQKVLHCTTVIANVRECSSLIDSIINNKHTTKGIVSFDSKGINSGLQGLPLSILTLCQIATMNGEVYIFDIMACPEMVVEGKIKELLESENVVKVIHGCRDVSVNLYDQFKITLKNVFDIQVAHAVLQLQQHNVPVYKVNILSLNALCELYNAPMNSMKNQLKNKYCRDQPYWAQRPLSKDMIIYAASDILPLLNPAIYAYMSSNIKPENQQLFEELTNEQVFMHIHPTEVKLKQRQRKIDTEVGELKMKLAETTKTIVLSNREIRLLKYLLPSMTDDEKKKLKGCHKISKKLEKMEAMWQDNASDSKENERESELQSLEWNTSEFLSLPHSQPLGLTESMQMMDEILSDTNMDKVEKMNRLEAILSAVAPLSGELEEKFLQTMEQTLPPLKNKDLSQILDEGRKNCCCKCHNENDDEIKRYDLNETKKVEVGSQTFSTGDIFMTSIHFREKEKLNKKILNASNLEG